MGSERCPGGDQSQPPTAAFIYCFGGNRATPALTLDTTQSCSGPWKRIPGRVVGPPTSSYKAPIEIDLITN